MPKRSTLPPPPPPPNKHTHTHTQRIPTTRALGHLGLWGSAGSKILNTKSLSPSRFEDFLPGTLFTYRFMRPTH